MEALILFLFKNWYLVVVAVAFFYQLRARRARSQQRIPKTGMPSFGGSPTAARRPAERKERVRDEFNQSGFAKPQTVSVKEQKVSPFPSQTPKKPPTDSPIYANEISSSSVFPHQPSREQLLQGVVWAEILGPPRSKKPYRK